ncbi:MAG: ATP-dependent Clp protease proteolytic subunit [Candidatus Peribacteraceae bacterium]|nr:ATP-dependent Clp protease proteolytic subunit [Candidatus Peribacteraceae bacterium]
MNYINPTASTVPHVLDKTSGQERIFDLWSRLHKDRIIFLGEAVTDYTANIIVGQLLQLEAEDRAQPISLYINSPGGVVTAGLAIFDVMNYIEPEVSTVCVGNAASMGAFLLSAGAKGSRYIMPSSSVMIHQISSGAQGMATDLEISLKRVLRLKEMLNRKLAINTAQSYEKVCEDTERDYWMNAEEALKYGIVDKIMTSRREK